MRETVTVSQITHHTLETPETLETTEPVKGKLFSSGLSGLSGRYKIKRQTLDIFQPV